MNIHLKENENTYDVIDLDPFGSCQPYIDNCLWAIKEDGLLMVTTTDLKVLESKARSDKDKC
jgi:tRNA (guanine26-N2/guanine27-N2)-dimethyltransferase